MKIDRNIAIKAFLDYVQGYDGENNYIKLKIAHTFRVAEIIDLITNQMAISSDEKDLAWLIGMLHDVGRFEQIREYNTLSDIDSYSHAHKSIEILFDRKKLKEFVTSEFDEDDADIKCIYYSIYHHSDYELPNEIEGAVRIFCDILRDADKIDILRINVTDSLLELYGENIENLESMLISKEVYESILSGCVVPRNIMKTTFDRLIGHISMIYGIINLESIKLISQLNYVNDILKRIIFYNPENQQAVDDISEKIEDYIKDRVRG